MIRELKESEKVCEDAKDGEHVWHWIDDYEGDASVPGGVHDVSHWECTQCGLDGGNNPPKFVDFYNE